MAAIFAVSTLVVFVGLKIGTLISTVIAYIFLTLPIIFISIGSVSPGLLTAIIVAVDSAIDGKALDRRAAQEAGRFLVGYLLGKSGNRRQRVLSRHRGPMGHDLFTHTQGCACTLIGFLRSAHRVLCHLG